MGKGGKLHAFSPIISFMFLLFLASYIILSWSEMTAIDGTERYLTKIEMDQEIRKLLSV